MKKYNKLDVIVSAIAFILIIAVAATLGALQILEVINFNTSAFLLMFTILTLGSGLYVTIFGIVKKAGYELAVGGILFAVGVVLLFIMLKIHVAVVIIVGVALLLIVILSLFILKAGSLHVERANESEDFIPYTEKLKIQKQEEKEREAELPKIKTFKD